VEISSLYKLLPVLGGILVFVAAFKMGKAIKGASEQSAYFNLVGEKLRYRSGELNGINYGLNLEFLVSDESLGFRSYFPAFNYVANYNDIVVSKSKALIGYRISLLFPVIGELKVSNKLAVKINELSNGKLFQSFT